MVTTESELYEEEELLSRREFLKKSIRFVPLALFAASQLISCKDAGPVGPEPIQPQPATESEGRDAMRDAASSVMYEKGYTYEIRNDVELFTSKKGKYDAVVFADTNKDGQHDLVLGMNYVTEGETLQDLSDTARYKFKEITKGTSPVTTKSYLTDEFKKWMRSAV